MRFEKRYLTGLNWPEIDQLHSLAGGSIMPILTSKKSALGEFLTIHLPGIKDNRFQIEVLNRVLLITFWLRDDEGNKSNHLVAAIPLAPNVDTGQLEAHFEDGQLSLIIPFFGSMSPLDGSSVIPFN